jgi:chromosome segregation ATPase
LFRAVSKLSRRARCAAVATLVVLAGAGIAAAARGSDREAAEAVLASLKSDPADAKLAAEAIEKSEHALRRAGDARAAADLEHAALLEALGREWAEAGRDLSRAAAAEKKLAETQKQTADVETKLARARALLEETVARRGRAKVKLEKLEADKKGGTP